MYYPKERRVVITGLGIVASNGIGKEAYWQASSNGLSGIKPIQRISTADLPIHVAGEVSDFVVNDYIDRKLANRTDRMTHLAFAAIQEALQDAKLDITQEDPERAGVVIANTFGGVGFGFEQVQAVYNKGPRAMSAYTAIAWLQVANIGQTNVRYGTQGYSKVPINDTVGGLDAVGLAFTAIRRGAADMIITGGCEALVNPLVLVALSHNDDFVSGNDPHAYRPFDRRAAGLLVSEGAGICVLEDYEHAIKRGVPILGEIVGYGQTNDAHGLLSPSYNGRQYARALRMAMQEGSLKTEDLAFVSLDGRAIPSADQGEAQALQMIFGAELERLPVSVPRTMLGHSYAAAGAIDTITALMTLQHKLILPTINCEEYNPDYGLNLVRDEARPVSSSATAALIGGRGIGGANVAVAIKN